MRSYWDHLAATSKNQITTSVNPIFRASSIFPMLNGPKIKTRVIFFGYWMIKRKIKSLGFVLSLRNEKGDLLIKNFSEIQDPKAYRIELKELLKEIDRENEEFTGSLELEFFSNQPLVYAFPATTVNYYGETFSTFVHTAERTYNNYEDYKANTATKVSESGFNISLNNKALPFIAFVNGPVKTENKVMQAEFINQKDEILNHHFLLGALNPFETRIIYPSKEVFELEAFLHHQMGTVKLNFDLEWAFPRLLVGNFQENPFLASITHSYYDCSKATSQKDYWLPSQEKWVDASLMLPLLVSGEGDTHITFYPIYTPSQFLLEAEIYSQKGAFLGKKTLLEIKDAGSSFVRFSMKKLLEDLKVDTHQNLSLRLIALKSGKLPIPSRIKVALDITQKKNVLGCNICTNLQPFNPELEHKLKSFRWVPLVFDETNEFYIYLMNSSPEKHFQKEVEVTLTFYREEDINTIERKVIIPAHGSFILNVKKDNDLNEFFLGNTGWMTLESANPYLAPYYLALNPDGAVGGDHGY